MNKCKRVTGAILAILLLAAPAFAEEKKEDTPEAKTENAGEAVPAPVAAPAPPKWFDTLTINGSVTTIAQTSSGNNDTDPAVTNSGDNLDFTNSVNIGFASDVGPGQQIIIALEAGMGSGLTGRVGNSTFRPNYDAYPTTYKNTGGSHQQGLTVSQAYYMGRFMDGVVMFMVGRMDCHSMIDQNAFANSETTQFIGGPFVRTPGALYSELGHNGQYYANGLATVLTPSEFLEVSLMTANGEPDKAGSGGHIAAQVNIKPLFNDQPGNYRFYALQDYRDHLDSTGKTKADTVYGVSFDQLLSDEVGLFVRYAAQDKNLQLVADPLETIMSGGLQFSGALWGREADAVGIGYATGKMKPDVLTNTYANAFSGDQSMMEAYYRWQATPKMGLSADIQSHSNLPRVSARQFTAFALRMQLDF